MNKHLFYFLLLLFSVNSTHLFSQADSLKLSTPPEVSKPISLKSDQLVFTVEPAIGGRIGSLKFMGIEMLSQLEDEDHLHWGSTVWPSPQADWNWPPPEKMDKWPYKVKTATDKIITLESTIDAYKGLKVIKHFELIEKNAIQLTYSFLNRSNDTVQVGIWENTRIPYDGEIRWATPENDTTTYPGLSHQNATSKFVLKDHLVPHKLFIPTTAGWVAYYYNEVVFSKKFKGIKTERIAPEQAQVEVYIEPLSGFAEIEEHGPYVKIAPGRETRFKVQWILTKNKIAEIND